jgi:uncharacterized protein YjbI with pentapeptide repeats
MAREPPELPEVNPDYAATENGVVFSLFPDRLELPSETIVGEKTLEETKKEIASRGGDFVPTIKLDERNLQAADLSGADLRGVSLNRAAMQGADLSEAQLKGARLGSAQLQGANLRDAQLQGADLGSAELQGADLGGAELQGADLSAAQLQGANLRGAQLQGADLTGAQLQGADLSRAGLQGANLFEADLADGDLDGASVLRTDIAEANLSTSAIRSVHADQAKLGEDRNEVEQLNDVDVDAWIATATQFAIEKDKEDIRHRFERLKPDLRDEEQEATWLRLEEASRALDPDGSQYRRRLADRLGNLACVADGALDDAPYVARGLISGFRPRLAALGDQLAVVRDRMEQGRKMSETCPGVAGFTEDDWRQLDAIKPIEPAPAAAPADH